MADTNRNGYFHATPGRLRVRVVNLKDRVASARSLEVLLMSQPGIKHVRANPITSNVLVSFDQDTMSHEDVLQSLADLGHLPVLSEEQAIGADDRLCELGICLGMTIAKKALKQALKGSPAALFLELL